MCAANRAGECLRTDRPALEPDLLRMVLVAEGKAAERDQAVDRPVLLEPGVRRRRDEEDANSIDARGHNPRRQTTPSTEADAQG